MCIRDSYTDGSIDTAHIADSQVTTAKIADSAITSAKINDGAIVNADVNSSAAIDATKIHDGTISNTEFGYLNGVSSNIQTQIDAKGASITGAASTIATSNLTASRALQSNGSGKVEVSAVTSTELGYLDGVSSAVQTQLDAKAATSYVNDAVAGLRSRIICRAATTANVTLSSDLQNGDTLDGITLATGNRVLVKDQSTASQNGIYTVVSSGTAGRDSEFDAIGELAGQMVIIQEGSSNADKFFLCTTDSDATLGSDSISFTQVTPQNVGDVTLTGTQTLTNKTLTSPKVGTSVLDTNGNQLALLTATGSAVNEVTLANAATGNNPSLTASGDDTNIGIDLKTKGTGIIKAEDSGGTVSAVKIAGKETIWIPAIGMCPNTTSGAEAALVV